MSLLKKLDEIIEDPRKTKAVVLYLRQNGLIDMDAIALWEIEQANKEVMACNHCYPDGTSAVVRSVEMDVCRICGEDDYGV